MPVTFRIPGALRPYTDGKDTLSVDAAAETVASALQALWARYPRLRRRILTEQGEVRPHVNVFVGTESIRDTGGLATPLPPAAEIAIIAAVSGGA